MMSAQQNFPGSRGFGLGFCRSSDTLKTHESWHVSKPTKSATMSIWLESFYDMSILKWIALRAIWHKTCEKRQEVLSHWCHYLQWTGNLILPHFDLQMELFSLSGSQSTIFDTLKYWPMSILKWVKKKFYLGLVKLGGCQKITHFYAISTFVGR